MYCLFRYTDHTGPLLMICVDFTLRSTLISYRECRLIMSQISQNSSVCSMLEMTGKHASFLCWILEIKHWPMAICFNYIEYIWCFIKFKQFFYDLIQDHLSLFVSLQSCFWRFVWLLLHVHWCLTRGSCETQQQSKETCSTIVLFSLMVTTL